MKQLDNIFLFFKIFFTHYIKLAPNKIELGKIRLIPNLTLLFPLPSRNSFNIRHLFLTITIPIMQIYQFKIMGILQLGVRSGWILARVGLKNI